MYVVFVLRDSDAKHTHTHTHIHKKGWESTYRRGNSSTYLTNHANRGAIIDKEGGRGRRRRMVGRAGEVVGDSSSALLSLCLFPNNNALVLPSSIALQPPHLIPLKHFFFFFFFFIFFFCSCLFLLITLDGNSYPQPSEFLTPSFKFPI